MPAAMPHTPHPPSLARLTRQRSALARLKGQTRGSIHTAFAHAAATTTPALRSFTGAYASELARVRAASDQDDDAPVARVSLLWLHTSGALAALRGPLVRGVGQAAAMSLHATLMGAHAARTLGQQSALSLMRAIPGAPSDSDDDDDSGGLIVPPHLPPLPAPALFTTLPDAAWQQAQSTATAGVGTGQSAADLLAALLAILAGMGALAILAAGQTLTDEYRAVISLFFGANPDAVTGWVWVCSFDNSCAACIAMHGSVHDASETLDGHPNCACQQQPYSGQPPDDIQSGEDWFNAQDAATQTDIVGPAAMNAMQVGDLASLSSLIDTSDGYVSQASLRSLGLNASDYLT